LKNKNRNNKLDFRRTLITYFADLISKTSPDYVLMENVAGLANLEAENLKYFTDILDQEGFFWETNIVNAVNYGVPQNRRRFVLLASKNKKIEFPFGDYYGKAQLYKTVRDTIEKLPALVAGEINNKIPNHKCANLSNLNKMRIKATKQNGGDRLDWDKELWLCCHLDKDGNPKPVHKDTYGRMFWDKPSPTLTTKFNSITTGRYGHPTQDRAISLREGALLQSFPMDYIFYGAMQNIAKQIGNAVPPKMAEVFGKQLFI
jgi:DNA (cytosine-5)-methyltransferase 1